MKRVWGIVAAATAVVLLGGCAKTRTLTEVKPQPVVEVVEEAAWRAVATPADATRLEGLAADWRTALAAVKPGRAAKAVEAEGPLLDPEAAQPFPAPPPGHYRCRVVRIPDSGARLVAFKPWSCHVGNDGKLLSFTKEGGSDRPAGWMWADGDTRLVFLGAMVEGEEVPAYGDEDSRNLIGAVERVADFRWRMVLPAPVRGSKLDVIELIPLIPAGAVSAPA